MSVRYSVNQNDEDAKDQGHSQQGSGKSSRVAGFSSSNVGADDSSQQDARKPGRGSLDPEPLEKTGELHLGTTPYEEMSHESVTNGMYEGQGGCSTCRERHSKLNDLHRALCNTLVKPVEDGKRNDGFIPDIICILPTYLDGRGNVSAIELDDGCQFTYDHSSIQTGRDILRFYMWDYEEMRRKYYDATGRSQSMPIVIPSRDLVLTPMKFRTPRTKNDGSMGYIADKFIHRVDRIVENRQFKGLRVTLTTGSQVIVQMTLTNFNQQLRHARYFMFYLHDHGIYPRW